MFERETSSFCLPLPPLVRISLRHFSEAAKLLFRWCQRGGDVHVPVNSMFALIKPTVKPYWCTFKEGKQGREKPKTMEKIQDTFSKRWFIHQSFILTFILCRQSKVFLDAPHLYHEVFYSYTFSTWQTQPWKHFYNELDTSCASLFILRTIEDIIFYYGVKESLNFSGTAEL